MQGFPLKVTFIMPLVCISKSNCYFFVFITWKHTYSFNFITSHATYLFIDTSEKPSHESLNVLPCLRGFSSFRVYMTSFLFQYLIFAQLITSISSHFAKVIAENVVRFIFIIWIQSKSKPKISRTKLLQVLWIEWNLAKSSEPAVHVTRSAAAKLFFRLVAMLMSRGSRQVIMAIPAVRFLIMWWAATRMRDSSESRAKSFRMICSQVVMAILMERSTTGWTNSCTARSTDCRTHCFNWGWAWSSEIYTQKKKLRERWEERKTFDGTKREKVQKFQQMLNTYVGTDIDVWRQACQGVHIDIVVTELRSGRPSSCTSGGSSSLGWGRSCKWNKVSCWSKRLFN